MNFFFWGGGGGNIKNKEKKATPVFSFFFLPFTWKEALKHSRLLSSQFGLLQLLLSAKEEQQEDEDDDYSSSEGKTMKYTTLA